MAPPRNYSIRKMKNVRYHTYEMGYPYSFIGPEDDYTLDDIRREILVESEKADTGDFPRSIREHFWIREGEKEGDSWISCGELENGAYFFYTASCDYTGFDCQGGMNLWVSSSWQNIIDHAMAEGQYYLYVEQTEEGPFQVCAQCGRNDIEQESPSNENEMLCKKCLENMFNYEDGRWVTRYKEGRF
jgi:hypothetical protein